MSNEDKCVYYNTCRSNQAYDKYICFIKVSRTKLMLCTSCPVSIVFVSMYLKRCDEGNLMCDEFTGTIRALVTYGPSRSYIIRVILMLHMGCSQSELIHKNSAVTAEVKVIWPPWYLIHLNTINWIDLGCCHFVCAFLLLLFLLLYIYPIQFLFLHNDVSLGVSSANLFTTPTDLSFPSNNSSDLCMEVLLMFNVIYKKGRDFHTKSPAD